MRSLFHRSALVTVVLLSSVATPATGQVALAIGNSSEQESEKRILDALETRDSFSMDEMPLESFAAAIRSRFAINLVIDRRSLDDFGIDSKSTVSVQLRDATLESALHVALDSLELTWTIQHQSLVITTPESAEERLAIRVYPVQDLVTMELERTIEVDFDSLIMTLTATIEPASWDLVGGPGAIEPELASLSLVVSQTWQVHRQLEQLLTALRTARSQQGIPSVKGLERKAISQQPAATRMRRAVSSPTAAWQLPRVYESSR